MPYITYKLFHQDPTQPTKDDDPGDTEESSRSKDKEGDKERQEGGDGEAGAAAGDKDPPTTITTGATSARAVTIMNNPDALTPTVGRCQLCQLNIDSSNVSDLHSFIFIHFFQKLPPPSLTRTSWILVSTSPCLPPHSPHSRR